MCGISGFIGSSSNVKVDNLSIVSNMLKKISHRGPDLIGQITNEKNEVIFGHNRLNIQDLSIAGSQPMNSYSNRFLISFNGEIYNHLELRKELDNLTNKKINFASSSDTCTLVNCFEFWSVNEVLNKIKGMFAFALFDRKTKKVYLARDRFGEKPLFYKYKNSNFFFSSELKSFKIDHFSNVINQKTFGSFFKFGYIAEPNTIYKDIYKLEKGSLIELTILKDELKFSKKKYFDLLSYLKQKKKISTDNSTLENKLTSSVDRVQLSDAPLGIFLSSGIDSTLLLAISSLKLGKKIDSFTLGYEFEGYNELKEASKIAKYLGSDHEQIILDKKNMNECIFNINSVFDEPFGDHSAISTLFLSKIAKKKIKVALSGDGSDEQYYGYRRYIKANKIYNIGNFLNNRFKQTLQSLLKKIPSFNNSYLLKNIERYLKNSHDPQLFYNEILKMNFENLLNLNKENSNEILKFDDIDKNINFNEFMMLHDLNYYLTNDILVKTDRASMNSGLEVRLPFLDIDLVSYNYSFLFEKNYSHRNKKNLFKEILKKYVPKELINNKKIGFGAPVDFLIKGDLKSWAIDLLSKENLSKNYIQNTDIIQKKLSDHLSGKKNHRDAIWNLIIFQNWMVENA